MNYLLHHLPRVRGVEWAKTQTSINMAKQWESLLLSGVNNFKFFEGRA